MTMTTQPRSRSLFGFDLDGDYLDAQGRTPDQAAAAPAPAPAAPVKRRYASNAYPGQCCYCNQRIEANAGSRRKAGHRWEVLHGNGPEDCPRVAPTPAPAPRADAQVSGTTQVPDGTYTIVFEDESYRTLKVSTQDADADFMPGRQLVAFLSGSDNDHDYTRFGHFTGPATVKVWSKHQGNTALVEAVKVLVADPRAAAVAYGLRSEKCSLCGRTLTVKSSIEAGIGPTCAEKHGW